ncbi:hypothetical protein [Acidovorax sp. SDU_ACID1]
MPALALELLLGMALNGSRAAAMVVTAITAVRAIRFIREAIGGKKDSS